MKMNPKRIYNNLLVFKTQDISKAKVHIHLCKGNKLQVFQHCFNMLSINQLISSVLHVMQSVCGNTGHLFRCMPQVIYSQPDFTDMQN